MFARRWATAFGSILNHKQPLSLSQKKYAFASLGCEVADRTQLPFNPDGASCGFCYCYALETHLGTTRHTVTPEDTRRYYLRKLLEGYNMSVLQHYVTGRTAVAMRVSSTDSKEEEKSTDSEMSDTTYTLTCPTGFQIAAALADMSLESNE